MTRLLQLYNIRQANPVLLFYLFWLSNIITSIVIWLQKLYYYVDCCRCYKTQQKFFHSPFNFGDISNSFYFIDMPPIEQQFIHLKNAKLLLVKYLKKQQFERSQSINTEQLHIEDDDFCTNNTNNIKDRKGFCF